jgi:hypothetical protein
MKSEREGGADTLLSKGKKRNENEAGMDSRLGGFGPTHQHLPLQNAKRRPSTVSCIMEFPGMVEPARVTDPYYHQNRTSRREAGGGVGSLSTLQNGMAYLRKEEGELIEKATNLVRPPVRLGTSKKGKVENLF